MNQPTTLPIEAPIDAIIVLIIALVASSAMFWLLVRRWTTRRFWVALSEWARVYRFSMVSLQEPPPAPVTELREAGLTMRFRLERNGATLIQIQTDRTPGSRAAEDASLWNLLIYRIEQPWPPSGLRPTQSSRSVVDLFPMTSFPSLMASDRFVLFGTDEPAAVRLAHSSLKGLLPADIGLVLYGQTLVVDFSSRPFDPIEFERMLALMEQLISHVPVLSMAAEAE